jgi:polysaccharide deacetylase family protein (PEP-CTERM system associated)
MTPTDNATSATPATSPNAAPFPRNVIPLQRNDGRPRLAIAKEDTSSIETAPELPWLDLLTINLDDQLHGEVAGSAAPRSDWPRIEKRVSAITLQLLDRLAATGNTATFFVSGWVGDNAPALVREIARRGHEIASCGYYRRAAATMGPEEMRADAVRARLALEKASGTEVRGHRVARGWLTLRQLWALNVLAEEDFAYDSSFRPHGISGWPESYCRPHSHRFEGRVIHELPLSSSLVFGYRVPISGGRYMRRLPRRIIHSCIEKWHEAAISPWLLQFQVADLETNPSQASLADGTASDGLPRPVDPIAAQIYEHLEQYHFCSIATFLSQAHPSDRTQSEFAGTVPRLLKGYPNAI